MNRLVSRFLSACAIAAIANFIAVPVKAQGVDPSNTDNYQLVNLHGLLPTNYTGSRALGVYEDNVVGYGYRNGMTGQVAVAWNVAASSATDLHALLPGRFDWSQASAVDGNLAVGYAGGSATRNIAVLWDLSNNTATDLSAVLPANTTFSAATCIEGQKIGIRLYNVSLGDQKAFLFDRGASTLTNLHALLPTTLYTSRPLSVSGNFVVGDGYYINGRARAYHALAWDLSTMRGWDLHTGLPANFNQSTANWVNGAWAVGNARDSTTGNLHAFAWNLVTGAVIDLQSWLPAGYNFSNAYSIHDNIVIGNASGPSLTNRAFAWNLNTGVATDVESLYLVRDGWSYTYGFSTNSSNHIAGSGMINGCDCAWALKYTQVFQGGTGSTSTGGAQ